MRSSIPSAAIVAATLLVLVASACQPSLPSPSPADGTAVSPATEPHATLEPDSPFEDAPRVLRVHVVPSPGDVVDLARLFFVRGHVGPAHVRQVENDDLSAALTERILPAVIFARDGAGVLAPLVALEPGATYGVLSGDPPLGFDLHVSKADPAPLLDRVWPPPDAADAGPFAIFCGDAPLALAPSRVELDPVALPAAVLLGAAARIGATCLRIDAQSAALPISADTSGASGAGPSNSGADTSASAGVDRSSDVLAAIPPPFVTSLDGAPIRLVPSAIPLASAPSPAAVAKRACGPSEVPFGPGCARVEDDRLLVATPDAPLLWAVRTASGAETIRATAPSEPWVLLGLAPSTQVDLEVGVVDVLGQVSVSTVTVATAAPMAHVLLSEVLANPLGAEPDQEWVELYNDGLAAADLTGFTLADIGGVTALPPAELPPGAFALVVNDAFVEDDELDPPPAKGTLLLRVPKLGKTGLKNDGEPLKLLDPAGAVVSRLPATPKVKAGQSLARVSPSAPDGEPASFETGNPSPGAPN